MESLTLLTVFPGRNLLEMRILPKDFFLGGRGWPQRACRLMEYSHSKLTANNMNEGLSRICQADLPGIRPRESFKDFAEFLQKKKKN